MSNISTFQIVVLIVFGVSLLIGVLVFAGILPGFRGQSGGVGGTVIWWGTVSEEVIRPALDNFRRSNESEFRLEYVAKDSRTLESDLLEALASGLGPDLVSLPENFIVRHDNKFLPIPYESFSRRLFLDTFIRGGEIYLAPEGVLGLPLTVDPLVLYYNQDLFTSARLVAAPTVWSEIQKVVAALTEIDANRNLRRGAIALGQFQNIVHAKDILAMFIMQAGNPIVDRPSGGEGKWLVVLRDQLGFARPPAGEALTFFARFSDSANTLYSWNASQPEARLAFLRGDLAMYLGFASEADRLRQQNPQLNFDAALVPQRENYPVLTIARFSALAVARSSRNIATAVRAAYLLSAGDFAAEYSNAVSLPPARNDLLRRGHADTLLAVFYQAAIQSRAWPDPDPVASAEIFRRMFEAVQSGRTSVGEALNRGHGELAALFGVKQ